jgi:hypothetical protein
MDRTGRFAGLWQAHAGTGARLVLTLASSLVLARTYVFTYRHFVGTMWLDFWFWVGDFQRWVEHRFTFHDLIKPVGEHRIATTRPLLLLDSLAFDMNGRSVVVANLILLFGMGLIVARLVRQGQPEGRGWNWPPLFWVALTASVCQYENLLLPMDVGVALTCGATCAAILLLSWAPDARPGRALILAGGAAAMAVAAVFSMASGLLAIPALFLLLPLRRARPAVWAVFLAPVLLGIALFFFHYAGVHDLDLHLLDVRVMAMRLLYVGNFLGSELFAFPAFAAPAGFITLILFLIAAAALARRYTLKGAPMPAGDAALIALGVFVMMGGPVGSLSPRLALGGAAAALVPRYATYSLLLVAAVLGLYARWAAREGWNERIGRIGFPVLALAVLAVANVPDYDRLGRIMRENVAVGGQLLRNDVAVQGPVPWYLGADIDDIRDAALFLHAHALNIFSSSAGPPAEILAALGRRGDVSDLPLCRGNVDQVHAIDSTGILLSGWAADAQGRETAPWVAFRDGNGTVLGTARPLLYRSDVRSALKMTGRAYGFQTGFRLAAPVVPGAKPTVQVLGLFPGAAQPICRLPEPAVIGPVLIEPAAQLDGPAPVSAMAEADGPVSRQAGAAPPGSVDAWEFPIGPAGAVLRFRLRAMPEAGRALAVPFAAGEDIGNRHILFTFGDGARLESDLSSFWSRGGWRAAVVPTALLEKHGGPVTVEVRSGGDSTLTVGAPLSVTTRPDWSRLF